MRRAGRVTRILRRPHSTCLSITRQKYSTGIPAVPVSSRERAGQVKQADRWPQVPHRLSWGAFCRRKEAIWSFQLCAQCSDRVSRGSHRHIMQGCANPLESKWRVRIPAPHVKSREGVGLAGSGEEVSLGAGDEAGVGLFLSHLANRSGDSRSAAGLRFPSKRGLMIAS